MKTHSKMNDYDVLKETLEVLRYFDNDFIDKIPDKFLYAMKELALKSSINVKIDDSKSLKEQDISDSCKDMIALIYYSYVATKEEKVEITKIWENNENIYQKMLHEKYNPDNLFDNKKEKYQEETIIENMLVEIEEKSVIQKIIDFIKGIFKK